ncbi:hypothetical protein GGS20DRAFT_578282 [Poronia punctata]|nr:hypothetical protein GGS20DRAFT_578282 [Poronia punctata]
MRGKEKFPGIEEEPGFPLTGVPLPAVFGTESSITFSPPESTISPTPSIDSEILQFTDPDISTEFYRNSGPSRGPSPLRHFTVFPADIPGSYGRQFDGSLNVVSASTRDTGVKHRRTRSGNSHGNGHGHGLGHVCLWGNNGVCTAGDFPSRKELNKHVKMEHLLECPIAGCTEGVFENKDLLDCHMRWDHEKSDENSAEASCRTSNLLDMPTHEESGESTEERRRTVATKVESVNDRALKMEMSIGISKKQCREQLRTVYEKKRRRINGGGQAKTADSPGIVGNSRTSTSNPPEFPIVWEHAVLPFLVEFIPKWCGPGHVISLMRGRKPGTRRICIMTEKVVGRVRRMIIAGHVRDLLPEAYQNTITFVFTSGEVVRLTWARGLGETMPDDICSARNPFAYLNPCMGDSIGASLDDGEEATATLGPCVTAEGGSFWLACFHPFIGASRRTSPVEIQHPSPQDRAQCVQERHDALGDMNFRLGNLTATSGLNLKTTRITHDPYWDDCEKERPLIVTDWTLISSNTHQANMLRKFPNATQRREALVTSTSSVTPGGNVVSTGRTSGFKRGQVCEAPAYVDAKVNGTGKATREWFIEEPYSEDDEEEWIRGGIGVEGDSGAAIVDSDTNALIGQLWGRNKYWGPGPRITYFTPISDIFDDIQEKCGMLARPQLPQYRDEADRWPAYPVCRQCFDLRAYLDSRRTSRESLVSMIGMHDMREHDNDLTSVSELATPKDQPHYPVRHVRLVEDANSLFGSVASPESSISSVIRSPYPQALNDEDLYDPILPNPPAYAGNSKRHTTFTSATQPDAQPPENKKRRIGYGHVP